MSFKRRAVNSDTCNADTASALLKGFALLRAFRPGEQYLGNKELSQRTGFSKSTVSRLTGVLTQLGYLRYSSELGRYALGIALLTLSHPMLSALSIRHIARPHMKDLADALGGQVSLGMRVGGNIVYIESCRSMDHVLTVPEIGAAIPIISSAIGRAYLAALPPAIREQICTEIRLADPSEWEDHRKKVQLAAEEVRDYGFTRSFGEIRPELRSCGTALRSRVDNEIVVMNCGLPTRSLKRNQLESVVGPQLVATASAIDAACGTSMFTRSSYVARAGKNGKSESYFLEEAAE